MEKFINPKYKVKTKQENEFESTFELSPLEKGFGQTLGNSIRRSLLSVVPNVAVFAIKVKNANHEFVSLKNVKEDLIEIILNIKEISLKRKMNIGENEYVELKLISKKGKIHAKNIELPPEIEIVNTDKYIAETAVDGALEMSLYVKEGRTFKTFAENRETVKNLLNDIDGIIPIDSNFTPVENVSYSVSTTNPGAAIEQEKLLINVKTNGSIIASEAIAIAANVMIKHYEKLLVLSEEVDTEEDIFEQEVIVEEVKNTAKPIIDLDLSVRSYNSLRKLGIERVDQLIEMTLEELQNIKYLGKKSIDEVKSAIYSEGLNFKGEENFSKIEETE